MQHGCYHPITQCKMVGAFDKDNNLTGLHMRISGQSILATVFPPRMQGRQGPGHVPGPQPVGRDRVRLHRAEPADRPRHAQPARAAGLLARRQHQPERDLRRMLHGRACAFDRRRRAGVPAQADEQAPEEPRGAQCGGREDRLGQARAAGRLPRPGADDGVRQLRGRRRRSLGGRRQDQDPPHRRRDRSGLRRQSGADRAAGRRLVRVRPLGAVLRRDAP